MLDTETARRARLDAALARAAGETRAVEIGRGALRRVAELFGAHFGDREPVIVADAGTFKAAGRAVQEIFRAAGVAAQPPFIFTEADLHAQHDFVDDLDEWMAGHNAAPVAVGSGTINDLVKLAAHHAGRPYLVVATAASMDGYASFGASITKAGVKQTFECPAPVAVVADLDVIAAAPARLNAAGYADLLAKNTARADWIVADALGIEPIDPVAWELVHGGFEQSVADPAGVRRGDADALAELMLGLVTSGLAMQVTKSSRPASGAEHQFSHLWDMQRDEQRGGQNTPLHGFQVGIGTLAVARLYEQLLAMPLERLDVQRRAAAWPDEAADVNHIVALFDSPALQRLAAQETRTKKPSSHLRRHHLSKLRDTWPVLRAKLEKHLIPSATLAEMLADAGAPTQSQQIGISARRLRESYRLAFHIRRRYTVLDLAERAGVMEDCLARVFDADSD